MALLHTTPEPAVGDTWIYPYDVVSDVLTVLEIESGIATCEGRGTGRRQVAVSELKLVGRKTI